jgi:hypothetical protein
VHLVGIIIGIHYDARTTERQININVITHQSIEAGYLRYEDTSGRDKGYSRIETITSKVLSSVI